MDHARNADLHSWNHDGFLDFGGDGKFAAWHGQHSWQHWHRSDPHPQPPQIEYRSFDGSQNSQADPLLNAAGTEFGRIGPAHFADGISVPVGGNNPRTISNLVVGAGDPDVANPEGVSAFMYAWGQFIDHDLTLTRTDGVNSISVVVPAGDPVFPAGSIIPITRAVIDPSTGPGTPNPAIPLNAVTAWLDASMVYGTTATIAASLRLPDGHMKTSAGGNLPIVDGMFAAGDPRVAENPALTSLHTLFVREHNYQVDRLHRQHPGWSGDTLYDHARAIVAAEIAHITYSEFLPNLLGPDVLSPYAGYDPSVDPHLTLEFAVAAFRFGHSIVSGETENLAENGTVIAGSEDDLKDVFFQPPANFIDQGGADGQLRHLAADPSQALDARIVDDLRNFLVDPPAAMDLAAINIMRARDVGIGTLNQTRASLGLDPYTDFAQITNDPETLAGLRAAYVNVNNVGLWTGGLSETHRPGALVGETFQTIMAMQFEALRDGDRLWFENQGFDAATLHAIEQTTLADIILRNTNTQHIQDHVFVTYSRHTGLAGGIASEDPEARQLVIGSNGRDTLIGGPQGDDLFAGAGRQTLTGLGGADRFVLAAGTTKATITDFEPGIDVVALQNGKELHWDEIELRYHRGSTIAKIGNHTIELVGVHPDELLSETDDEPPAGTPGEGDFNGDQFGDLFLFTDGGASQIWLMHEHVAQGVANLPSNGSTWHVKALADFDPGGQGKSDILWQNDNGALAVWQMDGVTITGQTNLRHPGDSSWHAQLAKDFDGNGTADILLQNDNGQLALWLMQDSGHLMGAGINIIQNPGAPWHAVKGGDFTGDGKAGILFESTYGNLAIWEDLQTVNGLGQFQLQRNLPDVGAAMHAKAVIDFDGDGKADILLQHDNGMAFIWLMDGAQIRPNGMFFINGSQNNGPTWHVDARDMNGDGRGDLLWQSDNGLAALWEDFTPGGQGIASFTTQLNFVQNPNPSGQLDWHIV